MRAVSDRFLRAVGRGTRMVTTVDICDRAGKVLVPDVRIDGGKVSLSRVAAVYAACDLSIVEPERVSVALAQRMSPWGYEARIRRGVRFREALAAWWSQVTAGDDAGLALTDEAGDELVWSVAHPAIAADEELIGLGVFHAQRVDVDALLGVRMSGADRSKLVADNKLTADLLVAAGSSVGGLVTGIVQRALGYAPGTNLPSTPNQATDITATANSDPWKLVQDLAVAVGMWARFDEDGKLTLQRDAVLAEATPVWKIADGEVGTMKGVGLSYERSDVSYTEVATVGVNTKTGQTWTSTVKLFAPDQEPRPAPTVRISGVGSQAQVDQAALAVASWTIGAPRKMTLTAAANTALEPGDVVIVDRSALGIADEVHVINTATIDLGVDDMQLETLEQ